MDKVIKEIIIKNYIYDLGYDLCGYNNKIFPSLEIYKKNNLFIRAGWDTGVYDIRSAHNLFYYTAAVETFHFLTIDELFKGLNDYIEIPREVEKEFVNMFILYKLNNFKEN